MKAWGEIVIVWLATALALPAYAQDRTLARLNHEVAPDITRPRVDTRGGAAGTITTHPEPLFESAVSRSAATALFVNGNLLRARQLAERAWRRDHRDAEALFVLMEVAAMQADETAMLNAALRLCEVGGGARQDPRIRLAAARIRESAANTAGFRPLVPRVQTLLANSSQDWPELSTALLSAAMDGVPGLDPEAIARASGILTEWRLVGPLGRHAVLGLDEASLAQNDNLTHAAYEGRTVENFQFPDGVIKFPPYFSRHGVFYAAAQFASLAAGAWIVRTESAGELEIYIDGKRVLRQEAGRRGPDVYDSSTIEAPAGPHRVLAKFAGGAVPLRVAVTPATEPIPTAPGAKLSAEELTYDLAATAYAAGDFDTSIKQINALTSASGSAGLQFLLAQSWRQKDPKASEGLEAWNRLLSLAPGALAGDEALGQRALASSRRAEAAKRARRVLETMPNDILALETLGDALAGDPGLADFEGEPYLIWSQRLAEHPSCDTAERAMTFYRSQDQFMQAAAAQQKLDGCAPESLAYANSLARQGRHMDAAHALQQLVAASPLDRSARPMLVRELQLAGDDPGAARAAEAWLRIAPNASEYRRLATAGGSDNPAPYTQAFYTPYRRDAAEVTLPTATRQFSGAPVVLVNDHVAILRTDGSVSLYVHTTTRFSSAEDIQRFGGPSLPRGAQLVQLRLLHLDGSATALGTDVGNPEGWLAARSGDTIDEEYVVNYAGDGGIPEHPEVFQFTFGRFAEKVLSARFVVLTPAGQADRDVVIASSDAPRPVSRVKDNMLARIWERNEVSVTSGGLLLPDRSRPIVRVVEQENGWAVPSDAEHHRRIETIHRGPRFEESSAKFRGGRNKALASNQL
jgi:hypothetical protein